MIYNQILIRLGDLTLKGKNQNVFLRRLYNLVYEKLEGLKVEIEIRQLKFKMQESDDIDSEMLKDIDKTTIIKLSNKKSYRISPIRNKEVKDNKDETEILFDEDMNNNSNDELELI